MSDEEVEITGPQWSAAELLDLLDLVNEETVDDSQFSDKDVADQMQQKIIKMSETAFKMDRWSKNVGQRMLDGELMNDEIKNLKHVDGNVMADMHHAAFEFEPELVDPEACMCPDRRQWIENMLNDPEFQKIRRTTVMDYATSNLVTERLAMDYDGYVSYLTQQCQQGKEPNELDKRRQAHKSAADINQTVSELNDMNNAFGEGFDDSAGGPGKKDLKAMLERYKKLQSSRMLRGIIRRAGSFRMLAQSMQRIKMVHGPGEFTDVVPGDDIEKLMSSEKLAIARGGVFRKMAFMKIIERQAMCRHMEEPQSVGRGPIAVFVDESGSMDGDNIETAKAMALAIAWIAKQQKRYCYLVGFAGHTDINAGNLCELAVGEKNSAKVMEWCSHYNGGGTAPDLPFSEVKKLQMFDKSVHQRQGRADIIVITDDEMHVEDQMISSFNAWKRTNDVHCYGICIGGAKATTIAPMCDRVWAEKEIELTSESTKSILSI